MKPMSGKEYMRLQQEAIEKLNEEIRHRTRQTKCGLDNCNIEVDLQECSRCKIRKYCCKDHQRSDWVTHKKHCRIPIVDLPGPEVHKCPDNYDHNTPHSERAAFAIHLAEQVDVMLTQDMYPPEDMEVIYGIEMGSDASNSVIGVGIDFPVGKLMYNVWMFLYKMYFEFETEYYDENDQQAGLIARENTKKQFTKSMGCAFLSGDLPGWFQRSVEMYRIKAKESKRLCLCDSYVEELNRREFKGIKWDNEVLSNIKVWPRPGDPVVPSTDPYHYI